MNENWFERGHVAIVTGASKGFGYAVATELAQRGIRLIIDARGEAALREAEERLRARTEVVAVPGDVSESAHVHALVSSAQEHFGRLDLIVNNASTIGRSPMPPLARLSPAVFERLVSTNLYAPLHLIQHAITLMEPTGGTIVNVTSDAGVEAYAGWGGYGLTKAALEHASRVLARELEGTEISVIVADPGNMNTELHRDAEPGEDLSALADAGDVATALMAALAMPRERYLRVELQRLRAEVNA